MGKVKKPLSKTTTDRRASSDRRGGDRRVKSAPVAVERRNIERRAKVSRRRQIDPTTCERDYTPAEVEFMSALDEYKRSSGRMFPTCSEVLEVLLKLGYEKITTTTANTDPVSIDAPASTVSIPEATGAVEIPMESASDEGEAAPILLA